MKKFLKTVVFACLAAVAVGTCMSASAEEANKQVKVLCVGNSILAHGPNVADLGWAGNWGMAASAEDKDYYHVLQSIVAENYPDLDVKFDKAAVASLERSVDGSLDRDYSSEINSAFNSAVKRLGAPDIVTLQIGENVSASAISAESYANALIQIADYFKAQNPNVQIIYCKTFWKSGVKANAAEIAAEKTGSVFADLSVLDTNENKAIGLFEHTGVAGHPGDKGMQGIAEILFAQMKPALNKAMDEKSVCVAINGTYVNFDVPAQIINDRTMVPLRAIFEALHAEVSWDDATKTASSKRDDVEVSIKIGENKLTKNGEEITLDVPAQIVDSRTLVPVRAISEAYDCEVKWNADFRRVEIKSNYVYYPGVVKEIPTQTMDDDNKLGFYTSGNEEMTIEADPDDASNKVIKITAVSQSKFWAYIWYNKFMFKAGATYKFSADVRPIADASGAEHESYTTGLCFRFLGKDNGILKGENTVVKPGQWNHVEAEFTIPENYVYSEGDDKIGVYFNPINDLGISFMADNITVELVD